MGIFYDPDTEHEPEPEAAGAARRRVVIGRALLRLALVHAPDEIKERVEAHAEEVAGTLVVTTAEIRKIVREVAGDFNLKLSDEDVNFATRLLIERHLEAEYLRERIDDHLGEQAEETLKELRYDLGEGG